MMLASSVSSSVGTTRKKCIYCNQYISFHNVYWQSMERLLLKIVGLATQIRGEATAPTNMAPAGVLEMLQWTRRKLLGLLVLVLVSEVSVRKWYFRSVNW